MSSKNSLREKMFNLFGNLDFVGYKPEINYKEKKKIKSTLGIILGILTILQWVVL